MAEDILEKLADYARARVREAEKRLTRAELRDKAEAACRDEGREAFLFEKALSGPELSVIAECKKASPSKGLIAPDFPYLEIARDYEKAGADAVSVLTEPRCFLGSDQYLQEISQALKIPTLRKDFTVDPYMIYEARLLGASAVLLIAALLGKETLSEYISIADSLGLFALVEAHDEKEMEAATDHWIREIDIKAPSSRPPVRTLSGGNAQKVVVAREVTLGGKLLVASQPTRGVDIGAIESIRSILQDVKEKGLGVLLVSAELEEIMSLSDRIIVMHNGKITGRLNAEDADEEQLGMLMMSGREEGGEV
jgi:indole-3-glycerol phosphate synthase